MKVAFKSAVRRMSGALQAAEAGSGPALPAVFGRVYRWFQDGLFRRLFKNAGILFSGNAVTALLGLAAVTLTARALGPEQFGILVLIQTYVLIVASLVSFQSWQALIKFGAEALEGKREEDFKTLIKFGTLLDAGSAVLGTAIAIAAVYWVSLWQGWGPEIVRMASLYSLVILFYLVGTPTAVLRLFDRFKLFAVQQVSASILKVAGVVAVLLAGGSLIHFLLVWMISESFSYLLLLALGWRELHRQGYTGVMKSPMAGITQKHPGLWRFVWVTNLTGSVKLAGRELDVMLVGAFMGAESTGIYKIAKYFAKILAQVTDPLDQSIYPDLARLWVEKATGNFRRVILRLGALTGALGIGAWVGLALLGRTIIDLTVGVEYRAAYIPLIVYMAPFVLFMFGVAFRSALLSMGQAGRVLQIHIVAYAAYFLALPFLMRNYDLLGAAISQAVFHSIWFVGMVSSIRSGISKQAEIPQPEKGSIR